MCVHVCVCSICHCLLFFVQVNDVLWDLDRPLESDCSLKLIKFDDDEGLCYNRDE